MQGARLWGAEDPVCTDPTPHDVHLAGTDLGSELPGGPAVGGERHLHDVARPLHAFHAEAEPERPARLQILDEPGNRGTKSLLLGRAKGSPVLVESRKALVGRQLPERVKEGVAVVEDFSLAGGDLLAGLSFSGLPRVGPEP